MSFRKTQYQGQLAGRDGLPHTHNPYPALSDDALSWFHGWHVATVERETGTKFAVGVPADDDELRICKPKRSV